MIDGLIRFCLDKAMTSYYAAMEEQVSIIVSIITALLTGGFIILFLDNQHVKDITLLCNLSCID